jgi:RNA polymerase sigma factor (sigma-70 family)
MADDVHQQVFIQAYRDLTEYRSLVSLRAWLLGIARHRVLDAAKSRRRISARISPHDLYQDAALMPSEPLAVATICMKRALEASLAKLPDSTRTLLLLRYQQGLSYQELGAVMRERPSTLQVRVNRALRKLRTDLERRAAASHEADLNLAGKRNKMRIGGDERA